MEAINGLREKLGGSTLFDNGLRQASSGVSHNDDDYISLTDMARSQLQEHIIFRWLSLKNTIEYLGEWEMLYNPNFNCTEFGTFRNMAGSNNFVLSVKTWIEKTGAIGIFSKAGRYGGTYAHRDIAYHFGMWISPKFQLLLVKEYQRLNAGREQQQGTAKIALFKKLHSLTQDFQQDGKRIISNQVVLK